MFSSCLQGYIFTVEQDRAKFNNWIMLTDLVLISEDDSTNKHKKMVCISLSLFSCLDRPQHIPLDTLVRFLLQHSRMFTVVAAEQKQTVN